MYRNRWLLVVLLLAATLSRADEIPKIISQSADGRYQVRPVFGVDQQVDAFTLAIVDAKSGHRIKLLPALYDAPHGSEWITLWHPRLPLVAVDVSDGRRFGHIEVYWIEHGQARPVPLPDVIMNALGRVHAVQHFNTAFARLEKWDGDSLKLLLEFNALNEKTGQFQGFYTAAAVVRFTQPDCPMYLEKLSPPKED